MCFDYQNRCEYTGRGEKIFIGEEIAVEFIAKNDDADFGADTLEKVKELAPSFIAVGDNFSVTKRTDYSCGCTDEEHVGEFFVDEETNEVKEC